MKEDVLEPREMIRVLCWRPKGILTPEEQMLFQVFFSAKEEEIMNMQSRTKKITITAMLCAIAFVVVAVGRIPVVMFLDYEAKDVIISVGGFLFGPLTAFIVSTVVSLVEMVTISATGPIGCIMNILSSCSFACVAAAVYKRKHTLSGAVVGLAAGTVVMTVIMILWNYLITPIYLGYPREAVVELLVPVILPFNLLKAGVNSAITILIYKPVATALRKAGLLESSGKAAKKDKKIETWLLALFVLASCIFFMLVLAGIL